MGVRNEHNRVKEAPYGKDFDNVLRRSKAFKTTTVGFGENKRIYHDDFEISPFENSDGSITWFCQGITLKPFKKHEGTKTFHWNRNIGKWEEVKEGISND